MFTGDRRRKRLLLGGQQQVAERGPEGEAEAARGGDPGEEARIQAWTPIIIVCTICFL